MSTTLEYILLMIICALLLFIYRLLTDEKVTNMSELQNAIKKLHLNGPKIIAVSSTELDNKLTAVVSTAKG